MTRKSFLQAGAATLATALLTPDAVLWTIDKNLGTLATRLGVAFIAPGR